MRLRAGSGVEVRDDWFGELVWAGPYDKADFDDTEIVFGSGARVRPEGLVFVSAGHTADRLHYAHDHGRLFVSNSLACLLVATDRSLRFDIDYLRSFLTIRGGIRSYESRVPTTDGAVQLCYFDNLVWDGSMVRSRPKPAPVRELDCFDTYASFLRATTRELVANAADPTRRQPRVPVSTCSAGYDSSTVTALVASVADVEVIGIETTRDGADDRGGPIADALGLTFHGFDSRAWLEPDDIEPRFVAAGVGGGSSIPLRAAASHLRGRVLFTGYHGDAMWDRRPDPPSSEHPRADLGGCDLQEFRLSAGFIHVMLPMLGSHQMADVHAISVSTEMDPWSVGGSYDRPICRRILETAGVPGQSFGQAKGAMQQWVVLTPASQRDFDEWQAAAPSIVPPGPAGEGNPLAAGRRFLWAVECVGRGYRGS